MASHETKAKGYGETLLLDMNNNIAEAPGANLLYEKDGKLVTLAVGNILPGITRETVFEICAELNIAVEEKFFMVEDLKQAPPNFWRGG